MSTSGSKSNEHVAHFLVDIHIRTLISDIRKTLRECSAEDVFITKRNQFSIDPGEIDCDYYRFLENDAEAVNKYRGEYMMQYSWAEFSMKYLE